MLYVFRCHGMGKLGRLVYAASNVDLAIFFKKTAALAAKWYCPFSMETEGDSWSIKK